MKKLILLLAVLAIAAAFVACGSDSPTGPSRVTSTTPAAAPAPAAAADTTTPTATAPDEGEQDASDGKGITAKFLDDLSLEVTSTNTGHGNSGIVCATNGFEANPKNDNLPGTPYPWTVAAKSTSVTPFPKEAIAAKLDWPEGVCEQTINVQLDAFRGQECSGKILAVVWPGDNPVTFEREPGEWEWSEEVRTLEEDWSECMTREAYLEAGLDLRPETPQGCFKYRRVVLSQTATRLCSEETQTKTREFYEYERCDCPVVCKEWYPGSLPEEGRGRITFMSKLPDGRYLWRIQNNTGLDNVTLSGPGLDETLFVQSGTIAAHITDQPYYGVSLNLCDGTRVHGTASANENVETWCEVPQAPPGECPDGLCFYEIKGAEEGTEGEVCEDAQGNWMRWGPSEQIQCVFDVPGIYHSDFRLTPGQSDPACLKYTGR